LILIPDTVSNNIRTPFKFLIESISQDENKRVLSTYYKARILPV
jgi:hypothetical protein